MDHTTTIINHIGPFIKQRRRVLRLSLQDVADRCGCTKSHVWELEKGRTANPTIITVLGLCRALQCSLDSLLGLNISQQKFTDEEMDLIAVHRQTFNP